MPIRPENKDRYPSNWKSEIRPQILARANNRCEFCGVQNHITGYWDGERFVKVNAEDWVQIEALSYDGIKVIKIVLTIAHLDHTEENCDPDNLRALCQRCHNQYDASHRASGRKSRQLEQMEKEGQENIFSVSAQSGAASGTKQIRCESCNGVIASLMAEE
jgi:5-methylcytosine-specific restriction endonuclease McrA